jgi:hypothetical protein
MMGEVIAFPECRRRHLGCCPVCGDADGLIDSGKSIFGFCDIHETRWRVGSTGEFPASAGVRLDRLTYKEIGGNSAA